MRILSDYRARNNTGLARLLAVLSAIVTMAIWGPLLLGLAFGIADSPDADTTLWVVTFWWVFTAWPVASAVAVASAVLVARWPLLAAWLLLVVAVVTGFPLVFNGLIALAAAALSYLYGRTAEQAPPQERAMPKFLGAAVIGVGAVALIL